MKCSVMKGRVMLCIAVSVYVYSVFIVGKGIRDSSSVGGVV